MAIGSLRFEVGLKYTCLDIGFKQLVIIAQQDFVSLPVPLSPNFCHTGKNKSRLFLNLYPFQQLSRIKKHGENEHCSVKGEEMADNLEDFKLEDEEMAAAAGGTGDDFEAFCKTCKNFIAKNESLNRRKGNCQNANVMYKCEWNEYW